eukprot:3017254-Alexandrium_andersonii.AAC.1
MEWEWRPLQKTQPSARPVDASPQMRTQALQQDTTIGKTSCSVCSAVPDRLSHHPAAAGTAGVRQP